MELRSQRTGSWLWKQRNYIKEGIRIRGMGYCISQVRRIRSPRSTTRASQSQGIQGWRPFLHRNHAPTYSAHWTFTDILPIWRKNRSPFPLCQQTMMNFDQPIFQKECEYKNCLFKDSAENVNPSFCPGIALVNRCRTYSVHVLGQLTFALNASCTLCKGIRKTATA